LRRGLEKAKRSDRGKRRIEVLYGPGEPLYKGYTGNVSPTGLMIRAVRVFAPGSRLNLRIKLDDRLYSVKAEVRWARQGEVQLLSTGRVGMGVRFLRPPEEFLEAISRVAAGSFMRSS